MSIRCGSSIRLTKNFRMLCFGLIAYIMLLQKHDKGCQVWLGNYRNQSDKVILTSIRLIIANTMILVDDIGDGKAALFVEVMSLYKTKQSMMAIQD